MNQPPLVAAAINVHEPIAALAPLARLLSVLYAETPVTTQPVAASQSAASLDSAVHAEAVVALNFPGARPLRLVTPQRPTPKSTAERLACFAEDVQADLLALVTHGRGAFSAALRGSITPHLLSRSPCPLLCINQGFQPAMRYSRMLFTTDFGARSTEALVRAGALAKQWGAAVTIYHKLAYIGGDTAKKYENEPVFRQQRDADMAVREREAAEMALTLTNLGVAADVVVDAGAELLVPAIAQRGAAPGTVVVVTQRHGAVAAAFAGGVTRRLLRSLSSPLLIFPAST